MQKKDIRRELNVKLFIQFVINNWPTHQTQYKIIQIAMGLSDKEVWPYLNTLHFVLIVVNPASTPFIEPPYTVLSSLVVR